VPGAILSVNEKHAEINLYFLCSIHTINPKFDGKQVKNKVVDLGQYAFDFV